MASTHPESMWVSRILPGKEKRLGLPWATRDFFEDAGSIIHSSRAYHVKQKPNIDSLSIDCVAQLYQLSDLHYALLVFLGEIFPIDIKLRVWHTFKIQLMSAHQIKIVMPAYTVQAYPPGVKSSFALCDTMMLEHTNLGRVVLHSLTFLRH